MPIHLHVLTLLAAASSSKTKAASSSGNYSSIIILLVLVAAFYFLFLRPRSKQAQVQRQMHSTLAPGDEVLTGAGIYGTVLDVFPDRITIETAPGTRMTVARSTVTRKVEPASTDGDAATDGMDVDDLQARLGSGRDEDGDAADEYDEYEEEDGGEHDEEYDEEHDEEDGGEPSGGGAHDEHGGDARGAATEEGTPGRGEGTRQ